MLRRFLPFVATLALIAGAQSANILGIFTTIMPSHLMVHLSEAKVLAENGHNVTIITILDPPIKHKDFTIIHIPLTKDEENYLNELYGTMAKRDVQGYFNLFLRGVQHVEFSIEKGYQVLKDQRVKDLYEQSNNKFDLVISGFMVNNYQLGLAQKLKAPVIVSLTLQPFEFIGSMLGNPRELSYVPGMNAAVDKGAVMNFSQRLHTLVMSFFQRTWFFVQEISNKRRYYSLYGDDPAMPRYEELIKNISLMFCNSHALSEGSVRPNVPAVIEIGGIQIKDQPDPLPKHLADFLDHATEGAILLSLGSNIKADHVQPEIMQKMFNVLSKLKQRIIWKWEDLEHTPGKSANILYSKWLPQDDILAHPQIKLFITHAGKGGITEAQYHGKPMLALPIFSDQPGNAGQMVKEGFGLSLQLLEFEENEFHDSLMELLENPKYAQKVKSFSTLFRDRPLTARQTVLYWSEYVMRHHGAKHLQSPVIHMDFIAAHNLDIYILLSCLLVLSVYMCKIVIRFVCVKWKAKSSKVGNTKVKKN